MRVAVLGAGAIGAYVGAALARGGSDVVLIARGAHLRAMREHGVRVLSPRGDFQAHPEATDDLAAIRGADVVLMTLKAHSLPEMAPRLGALLAGSQTAVIAAQNGIPFWYFQGLPGPRSDWRLETVDPGGRIAAAIGPERVIGCVIYCSTEIEAPGVIRHVEGTRFTIGEPDGAPSERCRRISEAFTAGGLKCPVEADLREQLWVKLLGNAAFNPMSALTRATMAQMGALPESRAVLKAIMEEVAAVAAALGVRLSVSVEKRLEGGIRVGDHKTSMLQDLEAGRRLELECIVGAVVELAERLSVPVPHTRTLYACTKLLDDVLATARGT
ncbi:MAG TPA: 2-dehydropantoate 2-reductase [Chloroflexota bacterium]|nr:2-dehydropantoate 2-reductase [Chloroflexota bacterium]